MFFKVNTWFATRCVMLPRTQVVSTASAFSLLPQGGSRGAGIDASEQRKEKGRMSYTSRFF